MSGQWENVDPLIFVCHRLYITAYVEDSTLVLNNLYLTIIKTQNLASKPNLLT